ncbi:DNA repair protein [Micromonospora sp. NPDC005413]|uniref:DNA repair protein n=1 Tax=Micromonospora sp. NPDC005413 TaxID=3154563 RepID=UPI0033AA32AD
MPIQPNDRYHQDPARLWRAGETAEGIPPQPRYRIPRGAGPDVLPWAGLNKLPPASSGRHQMNTH